MDAISTKNGGFGDERQGKMASASGDPPCLAHTRSFKALGVEGTIPISPTVIRTTSGRAVSGSSPPPVHAVLHIAENGQRETFLQHLGRHRRETTYLEMSEGLARSGIEKWTVDMGRMTMTFYDKTGGEMLVEQIS